MVTCKLEYEEAVGDNINLHYCVLDGGSRDGPVYVGGSNASSTPAARMPSALRRYSTRGGWRRIPRTPRHTICLQSILLVRKSF